MDAANEMAVEAFLNGVIGFTQISALVEETLRLMPVSSPGDLESVLALDQQARRLAGESLGAFSSL